MPDVGTDIRRYYEEIVVRVPTDQPIVSQRRGSSLAVGVAVLGVAAIVTLLIFGFLVLLPLGGTDPADPLPPITTPDLTVVPTVPDASEEEPTATTLGSTEASEALPAGRILFTSDVDEIVGGFDYDLMVINTDGTGLSRLADSGSESGALWSPDGTHVAFSRTIEGNIQVYVVGADGSGLFQLTDTVDGAYHDWSPDGTLIAFNGNDHLYVVGADGSDLALLSDLTIGRPVFSPDGTRIVFTADRSDGIDIYVIDVDGSNLTRLDLTGIPGSHSGAAWSPDGRIAFMTVLPRDPDDDPRETPQEVRNYLISPDGTDLEQLPPLGFLGWWWSPDGTRIAYEDTNGHLGVMDSDGSNISLLSEELFLHPASPLSWSPDSTHIAFSAALTQNEQLANYDIYIVSVNGSSLTRLTTEPGDDVQPVWSPTP